MRDSAIELRSFYTKRIADSKSRTDTFIASYFPEEVDRIEELQRMLQLRQSDGAADTEGSIEPGGVNNSPQEVAERFLLKQAFRKASSIHHPDKGGSAEDFAGLLAAYDANDLGSVQEYLLSHNRSTLERISYWESELEKAPVAWEQFKSGPEYAISQLIVNKEVESAKRVAWYCVTQLIQNLQYQLFR